MLMEGVDYCERHLASTRGKVAFIDEMLTNHFWFCFERRHLYCCRERAVHDVLNK